MAKQDRNSKVDPEVVMGYSIPSPTLTKWAWVRLSQYVILPFLGGLLLLDVLFYFIFKYAFDLCYGVMCLID